MTIKQQGGVFGRNPTFNNVEVDGDATFKDGAKALFGDGGDLQIYHSGSSSTIYDAGTGGLNIGSNQLVIKNAAFTKNGAVFNENADVRFFYDGVFKAATTASGFSVTGNVALTDGGGIDFSATSGTGTSELFDDYEEGTWTPTFAITGGSFSAITYNSYTGGSYTKIGNMVTVTGYITTNSLTVGTGGPLTIGGLPFAPASGTGLSTRSAVSIGSAANWASGYPISGRLQAATTSIFLQKRSAVDGATSAVQASDMGITTQDNELSFSAVYFT